MGEAGDRNQESILRIEHEVSLAPLTTLELGGTASSFATIDSLGMAKEAIRWAGQHSQPVAILGGGSNVVVSDEGFGGIAVRAALRGIELEDGAGQVRVTAAAGEPWDELVEMTVAENLAGLECLSGIPGWVGATPIQNVGAYQRCPGARSDEPRGANAGSASLRFWLPNEQLPRVPGPIPRPLRDLRPRTGRTTKDRVSRAATGFGHREGDAVFGGGSASGP